MSFKLPLFFALTFGISFAFADDDFDLPDDVQSAEVPATAEDIPEGPVNFAPIEETTTGAENTADSASSKKASVKTENPKAKEPVKSGTRLSD